MFGDREREGWTRLVREEALALLKSRHVGMHCIDSRTVANTAQLPICSWNSAARPCQRPRALREGPLTGTGAERAKVGTCDDFKFITEVMVGSDEFRIGVTEPWLKGVEGACKEEIPGSIPSGWGGKDALY
eukprot:1161197-Pelagomonas_calceolata.AAC.2